MAKSRLLSEMASVPQAKELVSLEDDIVAANEEYDQELRDMEEPKHIRSGRLTGSRSSTPATCRMTRPECDFVRRALPVEMRQGLLHDLSTLQDLAQQRFRQEPQGPHSRGICGIRWTQMLRPCCNDVANESYQVECSDRILSQHYLRDAEAQWQFWTIHTQHVNGACGCRLCMRRRGVLPCRFSCFPDVVDWLWGLRAISLCPQESAF